MYFSKKSHQIAVIKIRNCHETKVCLTNCVLFVIYIPYLSGYLNSILFVKEIQIYIVNGAELLLSFFYSAD